MANSGHRPQDGGAGTTADTSAHVRRRQPRWLIAVVAVVLAGVAGVLAGLPFSRLWGPGPPAEAPSQAGPTESLPEDLFEGAAFSPTASVEDLRQATSLTVDRLVDVYPNTADSLAVAARHQFILGSTDTALKMWRQCIELDPGFADAYFGIGLVARNRGDLAQAVPMFERVVELQPDEPKAPAILAEILMKLGRISEAVIILDKHVHTQPASNEAVIYLGQAYLQLEEYEKARQIFEALIEADPDAAEAYWGLGRAYTKLGQKEKAKQYLEEFRSRLSVAQRNLVQEVRGYDDVPTARGLLAQTLVECGQVHRKFGSLAEAEGMWQKAAHLEPKDVSCRLKLMSLYEEQGRNQDALRVCEQLAEIEPKDPVHWLNVGLLNGRLGRLETGREAVQKAIQLDPDNPSYRRAYDLLSGEN